MKLDVDLPQLMYFRDYHDADFLRDKLEQIIDGIQTEEMGCVGPPGRGEYVVLFYLEQDDEYDKCVEEYNEIEASWEENE